MRFENGNALDKALPEEKELTVTTALFYYGKGIAEANLGNIRSAQEMQSLFEEAVAKILTRAICMWCPVLTRWALHVKCWRAKSPHHSGAPDIALNHLREAVKKEDALPYDEP